MSRFRSALVALALGTVTLGAASLAPTAASAGPGPYWGGGHFRSHPGHWGPRRGFYGPRVVVVGSGFYPGTYGHGCSVRRFVRWDGSVVIRKRCF